MPKIARKVIKMTLQYRYVVNLVTPTIFIERLTLNIIVVTRNVL
jgi:hypothetical protein